MSPPLPSLRQRVAELHPRMAAAWSIFVALCVLLALLHLFKNAVGLHDRELWLDEASTYMVAQYPLRRVITLPIEFHSQPPLYYVLLHFVSAVSSSEIVIRGLSWLSCLLLMAFVMFGLNELRIVSRFAFCLLFVTNKVAVYLATELRPYGPAVLCAFVSSVLLLRLLRRPGDRLLLVAYTLALSSTGYLMAFDAWILAAHGLFCAGVILASLFRRGIRETARQLWPVAASLATVAATYYPYVRHVRKFQSSAAPRVLKEMLKEAIKTDHIKATLDLHSAAPEPYSYVLVALVVYGILCELRKKNRGVVLWLLIFFGQIAFVHGFLLGRVVASYRYILPAFPAFLFGVALGLDHLVALRPRRLWPVVLVATALLVNRSFPPFKASVRAPPSAGNWRRLHAEIEKVPGQKAIFFDTGFYAQMLEYVARKDPDLTFLTDGYPGLGDGRRSAGGSVLSAAYIVRRVAANAGQMRCFFYATDRRNGAGRKTVYEKTFVPEMEKRGYQKAFTLESAKVEDPYHDHYLVNGFCRP